MGPTAVQGTRPNHGRWRNHSDTQAAREAPVTRSWACPSTDRFSRAAGVSSPFSARSTRTRVVADAGVADDEGVHDPEVAAPRWPLRFLPTSSSRIDLGRSHDGRPPPRAVREVDKDIDVVHGLQILTRVRHERVLEVVCTDPVDGSVPGPRLSVLAHRVSLAGRSAPPGLKSSATLPALIRWRAQTRSAGVRT